MDVIIIDDDKFMKTVFSNLFKDQEISFDVYEDPHEGLESISSNRPHCAIIDYNMPALNGDDLIVLSSQRLQFSHTDFIMITGEEFSEMDRMKLMTLGFQYIFSKKELRSEKFINTINEILETHKTEVKKSA